MTTLTQRIKKGKKSRGPDRVRPMLATLLKKPFYDENYIYEVKWDGYRLLSYVEEETVRLDLRGKKVLRD